MSIFFQTFFSLSSVLLQLVAVIFVAGFLVKKQIIKPKLISFLSRVTIDIFLPALIFSKIVTTFDPGKISYWWIFPLISLAMIAVGFAFAVPLLKNELRNRKYLLALTSLQNATYLVLPIGQLHLSQEFDRFALYVFLFSLGINPALWSIGKFLVTPNSSSSGSLKNLLSAPLIASVSAVIICLAGQQNVVPQIMIKSCEWLGLAGIPLATFIFGATLGALPLKNLKLNLVTLKVALIKLILIPLITFVVILLTDLKTFDPLMATFLIIEASVAQASTIILQIRRYGGEQVEVSSIMIITYILSLLTLPFWVALVRII